MYEKSNAEMQVGLGRTFRYLWHHWRRRLWLTLAAVAAMLASVGIDLLFPIVSRNLVDAITAAIPAGRGTVPTPSAQTAVFIAFVAVIAQNLAFHAVRRSAFMWCWIPLASNTMRDIVTEAFARVQRFETDWHTNNFAGATVRKISRGMWAYDTVADTLYIGFLPTAGVLTGVLVLLTVEWPLLGAMTAVVTTIYIGGTFFLIRRYVAPRIEANINADSAIGASLADSITCNPVVKAFGAEGREDFRFWNIAEKWKRAAAVSWRSMEAVIMLQAVILVGLQALLIGYAVWQWSLGAANAGDVVFAITTYALVGANMREIGFHFQNLQNAFNEIEDVVRFLDVPVEPDDRPDARSLRLEGGAVCFDRVTFGYPNQPHATFEALSVDIRRGEKVALVGRSGSGKSSFVKLLQGLYALDSGHIRIDGQDIAKVTHESLRRAVALVPQEPVLFHRSIAENIAYARPEASREEIRLAATRARAHGFIERLPQGYDTLVGERGVKLSGGERQRIAIARAFVADAPILVLDEATSSLDAETEAEIQAALDELMQSRTTLVIAHRLSTIRAVDRILVFEQGAIVEEGSHRELLARAGGTYRSLHETQLSGVQRLTG